MAQAQRWTLVSDYFENCNPETVQAYGVRTTYRDHGFDRDNSGKCADYASFRWAGP